MSEAAQGVAPPGEAKELRLALVLYGGVSLCIYMHGSTKEIHRLVKASALLESGLGGGSPSERVYRELLARLAEEHPDGARTRVVVDAVAGTSAGGINGVFLAKAVAHNLSLDDLRELWLDKGDIGKLLRGPSWLPLKLRALYAASTLWRATPLRGDEMSRWLFDALEGMDGRGREPKSLETLMPARHLLELFVTATDFYGYNRTLAIRDPRRLVERQHRHVLRFPFLHEKVDRLDRSRNGMLAFAARATSCFPGAFPPVSLERFAGYLAGREARVSGFERELFRAYELAGADAGKTFFIDGGVLDNKPFGHVIRAIRERPAATEVDRRLLFLEPDPGKPAAAPSGEEPGALATVLGAASGIPRREPILDELVDVARTNERVQRIADIVDTSFDRIAGRVEKILDSGLAELPTDPESETFGAWSKAIRDESEREAGFGLTSYVRLKISGVVDRYAATVCEVFDYPPESEHAFFVRGVMRSWARRSRLFEQHVSPSDDQVLFLKSFDLGYGVRRLRFVVAGINRWYGLVGHPDYPSRETLDRAKRRLYAAVDELERAVEGSGYGPELYTRLAALFGEATLREVLGRDGGAPAFADGHLAELDAISEGVRSSLDTRLSGFAAKLFGDLAGITASWPAERRRDLLVRYLGFPFWDVLLYPFQALADVGERDTVDVVRLSPDDARVLSPPGDTPKLMGVAIHHFGAFFDRAWRENDYLWGRLDAAERLLTILLGRDHPAYLDWCRRVFAAVLDEEEEALPRAAALVADVRRQCEVLAPEPSGPRRAAWPARSI